MIRCDWRGDSDDPGTFAVKGGDGSWKQVGKLGLDDDNKQLVPRYQKVTQVEVERGPHHPGVRFAVKLIPIRWLRELVMPDEHGKPVTLGGHYDYQDGYRPETVAWVDSKKAADGKHVLTVEDLEQDRDYEIWVMLWLPDGSGVTKVQDPVIRTGGHIPTGGAEVPSRLYCISRDRGGAGLTVTASASWHTRPTNRK